MTAQIRSVVRPVGSNPRLQRDTRVSAAYLVRPRADADRAVLRSSRYCGSKQPSATSRGFNRRRLEADCKGSTTVIPEASGIQFQRTTDWMPAAAGMTTCFTFVAQKPAHVRFAHISQKLSSPEACPGLRSGGEGFQPSPMGTLNRAWPVCFEPGPFVF